MASLVPAAHYGAESHQRRGLAAAEVGSQQQYGRSALDRFFNAPSTSSSKATGTTASSLSAASVAALHAVHGSLRPRPSPAAAEAEAATAASGGKSAAKGAAAGEVAEKKEVEDLPDEIDAETLQRILDQADELHVEALSASNLKRCVAQLEKRIKKNQQDRIRHAEDPEKWVKSEVDLDEEIKRWKSLAAEPALYGLFISSRGLELLLSLLNHSNVDIQLEVLDVLSEFTDADAVAECEDPQAIVKSLVDHQLLELTVETLLRINEEAGEDEHRGVSHCLSIIENLVELQPTLTSRLARLQKFPNWLLRRVRNPLSSAAATGGSGAAGASAAALYDYNRIYASELLVILLQNSPEARETIGAKQTGDALDKLLRAVAVYRKRDPESSQEEEMVQNLFDALCSLLLAKTNQELLGRQQGIELMLRIVKERRFFYSQALKVLDFALLRCEANCQLFVEKLGLKFVFSIFMKKKPPTQQRKKRKANKAQEKQDEEHAVSIINSLCAGCNGMATARLLNKFMENQCEKIERLLELHDAYSHRVQTYFSVQKEKEQECGEKTDADDLVKHVVKELEIDEEEQRYMDACDKGLFTLQQIDCIIIRLTSMGNALVTKRLIDLINMRSIDPNQIKQVITDYANHMAPSAADEAQTLLTMLHQFDEVHAAGGIYDMAEDEVEEEEDDE